MRFNETILSAISVCLSFSFLNFTTGSFHTSNPWQQRGKSVLISKKLKEHQAVFSTHERVSSLCVKQTSIEELHELTKESFFCLRTPEPNPTSTCTVECKRKDGNPLGYEATRFEDGLEDYIRRAFVFVREPRRNGSPHGKLK